MFEIITKTRKSYKLQLNFIIICIILCFNTEKAVSQLIHLTTLNPTFTAQPVETFNISKSSGNLQIGDRKFNFGLITFTASTISLATLIDSTNSDHETAVPLTYNAGNEIVYILNGKYNRFEAWVGVNSKMKSQQKVDVIFEVFADGNKVFESEAMNVKTPARRLEVDISGAKELQLIVRNAGGGSSIKSYWAEPVLSVAKTTNSVKPVQAVYTVKGDNLTLKLSKNGEIVGLIMGKNKHYIAVNGRTKLAQCHDIKLSKVQTLPGGGMAFTHLVENKQGRQCRVTDRFIPDKNTVRWEVDIYAEGKPWSTSIISSLHWPATPLTKYWTGWSSPDLIGEGGWSPAMLKTQWQDPLETRSFSNSSRWFGGNPSMIVPSSGDYFSISISTVIEPKNGIGFSLVQSPEDNLLYMKLITTADGSMEFQRRFHRLGDGKHVRFTMDLVNHSDDRLSGLDWMVKRYPNYFEPSLQKAYEVGGAAAYSSWEGDLDADKLRKMAFHVNWKASFDFPYMGMFLPPAETWQTFATSEEARIDPFAQGTFKGELTSVKRLQDYSSRMQKYGFHVLNYFNVTEFGTKVKNGDAVNHNVKEEDLWKNCTDFLYNKIADGILYDEKGNYYRSWGDAIVTDPGSKDYQNFLLEQAQRHIDMLPSSSGICIDRMDWLRYFNTRADDGISWYNDKPARSLYMSWKDIMEKIGPIMHKNGKVIFANPMVTMRLDMMKQIDGIYSEHNEFGPGLNASALLGIRKPVLAWTWEEESLKPDPNVYYQRLLYLGVFPTAPLPDNNHLILPSEFADKWCLAYGPLFNELIGRKWVLDPHVINIPDGNAKANLYEVPDGYAIPIVLAVKGNVKVQLVLNSKERFLSSDGFVIDALHPGIDKPIEVKVTKNNNKLILDVPLLNGCALVRIKHKKSR